MPLSLRLWGFFVATITVLLFIIYPLGLWLFIVSKWKSCCYITSTPEECKKSWFLIQVCILSLTTCTCTAGMQTMHVMFFVSVCATLCDGFHLVIEPYKGH
jgi:hypothetical protein